MSNLRELARGNFDQATPGRANYDEIQIGALQRIADATELMARNHAQLVADAERWKVRAENNKRAYESERRSVIALRGQVTKLRNQLAAPARAADAADAARYRWICEHLGVTRLPVAIEEKTGCGYTPDGKASIDQAIDAALAKGTEP